MKDIPQWTPDETQIKGSLARAKILFFSMLAACLIIGVSTVICSHAIPEWYGFIIAAVLILLIIPLILLKKKLGDISYKIGIITNSIAIGFSIGSFYSLLRQEIGIITIAEVSAIFIAFSFMTCLLIIRMNDTRILKVIIIIALVVLILVIAYLWIIKGSALYSYAFYLSICLSIYCIAGLVSIKSNRDLWKDIFWCSCGAFVIIVFVVLIIIAEGDGFDGLDFGTIGERKKPK